MMSSPTPIWWWAFAVCRTTDLDALAQAADAHADAQFEGNGADSSTGCVSVRYLSGSPTMSGVKVNGRSTAARIFGVLVSEIDVVTLTREIDGAVFDAGKL